VTWRSWKHTSNTAARGKHEHRTAHIGSMRPSSARAVLHARSTGNSMRPASASTSRHPASARSTSARVGVRGVEGAGLERDAVYAGGGQKKKLAMRPLSASAVRASGAGPSAAGLPAQGHVRPSSVCSCLCLIRAHTHSRKSVSCARVREFVPCVRACMHACMHAESLCASACACVCVRVRACGRACVRAGRRAGERACVRCGRVHACVESDSSLGIVTGGRTTEVACRLASALPQPRRHADGARMNLLKDLVVARGPTAGRVRGAERGQGRKGVLEYWLAE